MQTINPASTGSPETDQALAEVFRNNAAGFSRNRTVNLSFLVQFGSEALLVRVQDGKVTAIDNLRDLRPLQSYDFMIKAPAEDWIRFWEPVPKAGSHDIFALTRYGQMQIQGNLHPLMSNLQFIKDLLATARGSVQ